jgi:type I restriction enzyme S subunit
MVIKEGFKQTEIGLIPVDWEVKALGDIGESIIGLTYSPKDVKDYGTLVLRSSNVQNNKLAFDNNVYVEMELPIRVIVKEHDILICVRNGSKHLIGKCALIDKETEGKAFGAFMSIYRSEFSRFVFHQFQANIIQRQINETMGATINQLTNKDLASFKIPLPPSLSEQTAIANTLSDADGLITGLEKLIAKKRNIKQGAMQQLLQPKEGWEVKKLADVCDFYNGKGHEQSISENGNYIVVNSKFVSTQGEVYKCSTENLFPLEKNDITIVMSDIPNGKALAKCYIIPENNKYTLNQRIGAIRTNVVDYKFLYFILNRNDYYLAFDSGTGQTNLKKNDILDCPVNLPATKEEQTKIATILSDMDAELSALEQKLEKYKKVKLGMMQELLTGKTRLV